MKEIFLTQGKFALVDNCEYERLSEHKWYASKDHKTFYARRQSSVVNGKRYIIHMHREVIGIPPDGMVTDHIDGDGLNNQRENLRFVTHRQNMQNRPNIVMSSQYPGVCWSGRAKKWHVQIKINRIMKHLGFFTNEYEAFLAYEQAVNALGESIIEGVI